MKNDGDKNRHEQDAEHVDLSALGMSESQWQSLYDGTMARIEGNPAFSERRNDPVTVVSGWQRPILAAAAILVAILIPVEFALEMRERNLERIQALAHVSSDVARGLRPPSAAELLKAIGGLRSP